MAFKGARAMSQAVPSINTTPLIDVLLVLLILLVVTLPRLTHHIALDLPIGQPGAPPPAITNVDVDFDGDVYWNGVFVSDDQRLEQWFRQAAASPGLVRVVPDRNVRYERVAQVLASAQRAHVTHLAVTPVAY
jgi:biopolymer transport protein ExbD